MKIARRAAILYGAGLVGLVIYIYLLPDPPTKLLRTGWFYLVPAGVPLMGLVIGWFGYMIIQHVKWIPSFYLFGMNLSFILFIGGIGFIQLNNLREATRYGTDADGRMMLEKAEDEGNKEIVDGFEELLRSFPRISQVHFHGWLATDTLSNDPGSKDTIKVIYYVYHLGNDTSRRISKMECRKKQQFRLVSMNKLPASDTLYLRLRKEYVIWRKQRTDSIISLLKAAKENNQ